jgi:hypothetical protein
LESGKRRLLQAGKDTTAAEGRSFGARRQQAGIEMDQPFASASTPAAVLEIGT